MIIDTTYLLPLARIRIDNDLLKAIADGRVGLKFEDIVINSISIFELQAKAAKLGVPSAFVVEAVRVILKAFKIEEFHRPEIIKVADELKDLISDYIDCIVAATAISSKDSLLTEDSLILSRRKQISGKYGIKILSFRELLKT